MNLQVTKKEQFGICRIGHADKDKESSCDWGDRHELLMKSFSYPSSYKKYNTSHSYLYNTSFTKKFIFFNSWDKFIAYKSH